MALVVLEHLAKSFTGPAGGIVRAVDNLSLAAEAGELLVLVGPSGCGKTTTLRLVAGLETPEAGTISIDGRPVNDVEPAERDVAMVFQNHALYPHMTARENMAFGLKLRRQPPAEIERRLRDAAAMLGLKDCLDRRPESLSGGQRQRVALGRALVRQPRVFLLDEPLSNLDTPMRAQLRREIARLHRQLGATMIYVTHDQVEAMTLGDRIAVMREGLLQQVATPMELYRKPANRFVAGFFGSPPMNFFNGTLAGNGSGLVFEGEGSAPGAIGFKLQLDESMTSRLSNRSGQRIIFGIRPEDIAPRGDNPAASLVEAIAEMTEWMGADAHVVAKVAGQPLVARLEPGRRMEADQKVALAFDMQRAHFFEPETGKAVGLPGLQS